MSWDLMTLVIKIGGLLSACGGPMLAMNSLKGSLGTSTAYWIGFLPVGLMMVGAFHLTDDPNDRWARWPAELGRAGMYVMVGMQLYGIWIILGGFQSPALPLYWTGIVTGLVSALVYQWAYTRMIARGRATSPGSPDDHRPIEPA